MSQEVVQMSLQAQNVGMFHNSAFRGINIKKNLLSYMVMGIQDLKIYWTQCPAEFQFLPDISKSYRKTLVI